MTWSLAGFLGSLLTCAISAPEGLLYYRASAVPADLPTGPIPLPFNELFRQFAAVSLLRHHIAVINSTGILTRWPSAASLRMRLRSRLTLIRLALIRKPWSFGGRVSHPPYRYLCLHLLFHNLHTALPLCFPGDGMLPYQMHIFQCKSIASVPFLMPVYYPRPAARLVSCYALFK